MPYHATSLQSTARQATAQDAMLRHNHATAQQATPSYSHSMPCHTRTCNKMTYHCMLRHGTARHNHATAWYTKPPGPTMTQRVSTASHAKQLHSTPSHPKLWHSNSMPCQDLPRHAIACQHGTTQHSKQQYNNTDNRSCRCRRIKPPLSSSQSQLLTGATAVRASYTRQSHQQQ